MLSGGCLCGAVHYEVDGELRHITHCHCSMCRKVHGAAFATYASLARRRLRLVQGEEALRSYRSSERVTRQFCGTCGSHLFFVSDEFPDAIAVTLGTLDSDPGGRPSAHIHTANRAPWYEIADGLPQHVDRLP
jgi:hypothetical protein